MTTFYVHWDEAVASDENPGTPEAPFLTVSAALDVMRPKDDAILETPLGMARLSCEEKKR